MNRPISLLFRAVFFSTSLLTSHGYSQDTPKVLDPSVFCAQKWNDDFVMQKHCIEQQWEARSKLADTYNRLVKKEQRIEERLYHRIVGRCAQRFGNDDSVMIEHCSSQQLEAYFSLNK